MKGNCEWLAEQFETHRIHLRAVAYRMLGSHGDANDAAQETWLRVSRAGTSGVENLGGWLTTILSRVCLDMLRSQKSRREKPLDAGQPGPAVNGENVANPEQEILLADSIGLALHMVLETLSPGERVTFVLHRYVRPLLRRNRTHGWTLGYGSTPTRQPRTPPSAGGVWGARRPQSPAGNRESLSCSLTRW